ncbi:hypothetical protein ABZ502_20130 [Streptomyces abikoensis]|uniref:hypothetical protein n=1 Tax=Streptomyces TaxID=1883 RepID=UPI00340D86B7
MPEIVVSSIVAEPVTGARGDPQQEAGGPAVGSRPWMPPAFIDVEGHTSLPTGRSSLTLTPSCGYVVA